MLNKRRLPSMTALQCFEAVARHLSFTRAAEELSLTQSAMSKQVAQLEEQLQHALFRRVRKRLQLTPAGEAVPGRGTTHPATGRAVHPLPAFLRRRDRSAASGDPADLRRALADPATERLAPPPPEHPPRPAPGTGTGRPAPGPLRPGVLLRPRHPAGRRVHPPVRRTTGGGLRAIPATGRRTGRTDPTGGAGAAAERQPRGGLARLVRQPGAKLPGLLPRSTLRHLLHVHPRRPGRLRGSLATALPGRGGTRRRQAGDRLAARPAQPGGLLPGLSRACRGSPQGAPFHRVDGRAPGAGATLSGPRQTRHGPV